MNLAYVIGLVLLHSVDGNDVYINPELVTSLRAAIPNKENKLVAQEVKCILYTTDGKFISVIETCDQVRKLLGKQEIQ
jgi:hypothetical protein